MRRYIFPLVLSCFFQFNYAQEVDDQTESIVDYYQYDQDYLPISFHKARRDSLRAIMPDSTIAVFFSAPERNRSNDVFYEYHQDPNFYYLSGYREPNSMFIISKNYFDFGNDSTNEILFLQNRNPSTELWNGRRLGLAGAKRLEFNSLRSNAEFNSTEIDFKQFKRVYFLEPTAIDLRDTSSTESLAGLFSSFKNGLKKVSPVAEDHLEMMMAQLRQIKTAEEIDLLRKAIDITCEAQNELMKNITPEMTEYQTEALIEFIFKRNGAEYTGFPSIQGSGENSCILHYTSNRRPLKNGGLLVSDVGAEYHGYTADVTRTIPPSGKFSKEEKLIYELVLKAQSAGIDSAIAGNTFWAPHQIAKQTIANGLKELGIIKKEKDVSDYFMHGTSHYLGLDVHDLGLYQTLRAGNVITVEPGIYIAEGSDCDEKWWNIGVRIEDDLLILEEGNENLSAKSPRTVAEIEKMMQNR